MNIVEIKGLVKKYGDVIAVDRVSINIEKGKIFGLLGPNGAGKSTIINLLTYVVNATKGEIKIFGSDIKRNSMEIKKRIGVVPQNLALYEDFTAYENLKFFGELYGINKRILDAEIDKTLEFVGLMEVKKKKVETYSGGMKRRLNIACAILHKPELIIMDEPTVGIDPQSRNHILNGIRKLNEDGATVIYTTHYMEEVEALCDEIAIIDKGRVLAQGTSEELKNLINDENTLSIKLSSCNEINKEEIKKIRGVKNIIQDEDGEVKITSIREVNNLDLIINYFSKNDFKIDNIGYKDINLESVFLTLTGRKLRD